MFGLDIDTLRDLNTCFAHFPQIDKVLIYGSRAKGNYKKGSDIDISLIGKDLSLKNTIYSLQDKLDDLYLPYNFDISNFSELNNQDFIEHILRVGKTLYQKPSKLPKNWIVKLLGEVCDIQLGKTPYRKNNKLWDKDKLSNNVWLSIADLIHGMVITDSKEYISDLGAKLCNTTPKNTIMLSFKLTIGRVSFAGRDVFTNEAIASLLNLDDSIIQVFLFYYFTYFDWDRTTGADIKVKGKTLNKKKLKKLPIPIPPLAEQQAIVKKLDALFTQIKQAKSQLEQNLQNTKDLWQSSLNQVFNNSDNGWDIKLLGEVCDIQLGKTPYRKNNKLWDKDKLSNNVWLSIADLIHGMVITDSKEYISDLGAKLCNTTPKNTIMLSFKLTIGRVSFAGRDVFTNEAIASLLNLDDSIIQVFLFYYFTYFDWDRTTGADIKVKGKTLNKKKLKKLPIPIPPLAEQQAIVKKLDAINQQTQQLTQNIQNQLKSLEELQKSLLEKAFCGGLV